jgi:hypothetical protein
MNGRTKGRIFTVHILTNNNGRHPPGKAEGVRFFPSKVPSECKSDAIPFDHSLD